MTAAVLMFTSWTAASSRLGVIPQPHDTLSGKFADSVVVESPLPDPLVPIVQWIFQRPGWVMALGIIAGAIVAVGVVVVLWRRRRPIVTWVMTRHRTLALALAATAATVLLLLVVTGARTYDYMMHDNDFCRGCHIFVPSGQMFVTPDTGTYLLVNKQEGKHDTLSCHACHPFEFKTQARELFYWIVERPEKIPEHAKVPRQICEECHVTGPARDTWKRVTTTAGHRTHLDSDSTALKDVTCLTCHARTAHRFQPADTTCAQQGCHFSDSIRIQLGRMTARFASNQPLPNEELLYCNSCHQFTADAQFLAPDSATGLLRPSSRQCFGCHEMRTLLPSFDPDREPHSGACGMCHNPHTHARPAEALKSCASAQCHGDWRDVDFHTGATHRKVAERCETCHAPHDARVDASDCVGCHEEVRGRAGSRLQPPLPFDTTRALREMSRLDTRPVTTGTSVLFTVASVRGKGADPPEDELPEIRSDVSTQPADTFSHERHGRLACLTCHDLRGKSRGLTFEPPRGCQICHHRRASRADCAACHQAGELAGPVPVEVAVAVPRHEPRPRTVQFSHAKHDTLACLNCHAAPVTLAPVDSARTCAGCHVQHHGQARDCATCHNTPAITAPHELPVQAHVACDACHTSATVARLVPARALCLACHEPEQDHYPPQECSACHFQRSPEQLRPRLLREGGPS